MVKCTSLDEELPDSHTIEIPILELDSDVVYGDDGDVVTDAFVMVVHNMSKKRLGSACNAPKVSPSRLHNR